MSGRRSPRSAGRLATFLAQAERAFLLTELRRKRGCVRDTAAAVGITPRALHAKLKVHGLDQEAAGLRAEHGVRGPRRVERDED